MPDEVKKPAVTASAATPTLAPAAARGEEEVDLFSMENQILLLEPACPLAMRTAAALKKEPRTAIHELKTVAEVGQVALQVAPCIVLITASKRDEIVKTTTFLKSMQAKFRAAGVRAIVLSEVNDRRIINSFTAVGASEVVPTGTSDYSFVYKLKIQLKSLAARRKSQTAAKSAKDKKNLVKSGASAHTGSAKDASVIAVQSVPPIDLPQDVWHLGNVLPKKVGLNVAFDAEGPPPALGEWVALGGDDANSKAKRYLWKFFPDVKLEVFPHAKGTGWVFKGQRPNFLASTGKWKFVSPQPELAYYEDGKPVAARVEMLKDGGVKLAKDSSYSRKNIDDLGRILLEKDKADPAKAAARARKAAEAAQAEVAEQSGPDEVLVQGSQDPAAGPGDQRVHDDGATPAGDELEAHVETEKLKKSRGIGMRESDEKREIERPTSESFAADEAAAGTELDGRFEQEQRAGTELKGRFSKEKREGTELEGEFASEGPGTELNGRFADESKPATELNGRFEKEPAPDWNGEEPSDASASGGSLKSSRAARGGKDEPVSSPDVALESATAKLKRRRAEREKRAAEKKLTQAADTPAAALEVPESDEPKVKRPPAGPGLNTLPLLIHLSDQLTRGESLDALRRWLVGHLQNEISAASVVWADANNKTLAEAGKPAEPVSRIPIPEPAPHGQSAREGAPAVGWILVVTADGQPLGEKRLAAITRIARELGRFMGENIAFSAAAQVADAGTPSAAA